MDLADMDVTSEYNIPYYTQEITDLLNSSCTFKEKYIELNRIFNEILSEGTKNKRIEFTSPFARFTYIAQQNNISHLLIQKINGLRGRSRLLNKTSEEDAERTFPFDVKSIIELLNTLCNSDSKYSFQKHRDRLAYILATLPAGNLIDKKSHFDKSYIRVSVIDWDENYIYANTDNDTQAEPIKICYNTPDNYLGNWSYIGQLLQLNRVHQSTEGVQLNLIRPRFTNGIYYPELIIYQPDFLVDISSISKCFESFGASPYLHTINKLSDNSTSKAILLGNFAGQLLDEVINSGDTNIEYTDSVKTFFRNNALKIVACRDDMSTFHIDAQAQKQNIKEIINTAIEEDKTLDLSKVLLEPSFFCEMLGIQGRMDLLHSDYKVLMEQKSGKKDFKTKGHVEQHYIQVLLYMALLHYSFNLRNDEISCFLLYSKYSNGLLKETQAPQMLFEAIKIRNQIVWNEFIFAKGGINILSKLTPEHLNTRKQFDSFWLTYKLPTLKSILDPIHNASELERAYFFRMFQFVEKEHILSKCGTAEREGSGMAAIWNCTIAEKKLAGNIFEQLNICDFNKLLEDSSKDGISTITLQIPDSEDDYLPNFRIGDIVILYKYKVDEIPDARKGIVFRTSIKDICGDKITLQMRAPQKNVELFKHEIGTAWAIEHDFLESTYNSLYHAVFSILTANPDRKQLILGQRPPQADTTITIKHDYSLCGKSPMFNELVLKAMQAQDYFLVIGPPGTGKTSFGMLNILKETLSYPDQSVLLLSYTNRAVDEICSKLLADGIDFIRLGSGISCPEIYKDHLLDNRVDQCSNAAEIRKMLTSTRVFASTTTSLCSHHELFSIRPFSLAIIDEASQILEPHLLSILTAKHREQNAIRKFVFIGDHKQLPAVVQQTEEESAVSESVLQDIGLVNCRNSLFERLLHLQGNNTQFIFRLNRQGRMHEIVSSFPSRFFYEDNLNTVPMQHQHRELQFTTFSEEPLEQVLAHNRLIFININTPHSTQSFKVNQPEAECIARCVYSTWHLYKTNNLPFSTYGTIGVIVPYRHQISTVRQEIGKFNIPELHDITIDTVERYQGSERDVIIYGFTVQRPYQLQFLTNNVFIENGISIDRKLNVALTRAREQMILVGNAQLLSTNEVFRKLIDFTRQNGYFSEV